MVLLSHKINITTEIFEKGKPAERQGRKARGLNFDKVKKHASPAASISIPNQKVKGDRNHDQKV